MGGEDVDLAVCAGVEQELEDVGGPVFGVDVDEDLVRFR